MSKLCVTTRQPMISNNEPRVIGVSGGVAHMHQHVHGSSHIPISINGITKGQRKRIADLEFVLVHVDIISCKAIAGRISIHFGVSVGLRCWK